MEAVQMLADEEALGEGTELLQEGDAYSEEVLGEGAELLQEGDAYSEEEPLYSKKSEPEQPIQSLTPEQKKRIKLGAGALIALVAIVILSVVLYVNSDSYKLSQANDKVTSGDYHGALECIAEIDSSEADEVRLQCAQGKIDQKQYVDALNILARINSPEADALRVSCNISYAEQCILQNDFETATNTLALVNTAQADAMRKYMELEMTVDEFLTMAAKKEGSIIDNDSAMRIKAGELLYDWNDTEINTEFDRWLPSELQKRHQFYQSMRNYWTEHFEEGLIYTNALYDVQTVFYNDVERNRSSKENDVTFTLSSFQNRIDVSENASRTINNWLNKKWLQVDGVQKEMWEAPQFNMIKNLLEKLVRATTSEIYDQEEYIEKSLEKFELDDKLYMLKPDPSKKNWICDGLNSIQYYDDFSENVTLIQDNLKYAFLKYCLENYQGING